MSSPAPGFPEGHPQTPGSSGPLRLLRLLPVVVLCVLIIVLFVVRWRLSQTLNVNWDELYFLSKVHAAVRGDLSGKLLTFHAHLFPWVTHVSANEVEQVLVMRKVMWGVSVVGAVATAFVGLRLLGSLTAALFAVFAGGSFSFVLNHGSAARFDPLVVTLFMVAAALLLFERAGVDAPPPSTRPAIGRRGFDVDGATVASALAGLAFALALLISIKAVFYGPSLALLLLARFCMASGAARQRVQRQAVVFVIAVVVGAVVGFAGHVLTLSAPVPGSAGGDGADLGAIFRKVLLGDRFAVGKHLVATLRWDFWFWSLLLLGLCLAAARIGADRAHVAHVAHAAHAGQNPEADVVERGPGARGGAGRWQLAQVIAMALPLVALAFYRNSFAYFYVSVIPPAALLTGVVIERLQRALHAVPVGAVVVTLLLTANLAGGAWRWQQANGADETATQKAVVDGVHAIFPAPQPYVDRCAMIGSFPKVGPFMSTWSLEDYRTKKKPLFPTLLRERRPKFLLANVESLELGREASVRKGLRLLPDDVAALKSNFIPWWGPVWIAGKKVNVKAGVTADVDVVIAGAYVVDGPAGAALAFDGKAVERGATVDVAAGRHTVFSGVAGDVTLRTASAQAPPTTTPPTGKIFHSFTFQVDD